MNDNVAPQANPDRALIATFDREFARLHLRSCSLVTTTPLEMFYRNARQSTALAVYSLGENLLRSAGVVEQTFGGITANLWDDPFEWTLPENLSTAERVMEYLEEVEATRNRAFARFARDVDLLKEVLVPAGDTRPLLDLLAETLVKAADYQGRAIATLALLSAERNPVAAI
jgi:hypothetical protein